MYIYIYIYNMYIYIYIYMYMFEVTMNIGYLVEQISLDNPPCRRK